SMPRVVRHSSRCYERCYDRLWIVHCLSTHLVMTNTRAELLRLLGELSDAAPDLRLGQLVANVASLALGAKPEAVWDAEDEQSSRRREAALGEVPASRDE